MAALNAENGDLKQPEAVEAPEALEQDMVEETNKSGGVAYQFNPDASPEEKAAAAETVCPRIICVAACLFAFADWWSIGCASKLPS